MIRHMTGAAEAVLAQALQLDPSTRAALAAELIGSLDGPPDTDADAAWQAEIQRRVGMLEAGAAAVEPWQDAKRRIERELHRD